MNRKASDAGLAHLQFLVLGITLCAIALFIVVGGAALTHTMLVLRGIGHADDALSMLLLANIAIIFGGWLRHQRLTNQLQAISALEQEARRLAEVDPLTGCMNRRSLLPAIDSLLADSSRSDEPLVLFLIDLDNFKQINDRHGHEVGDQALTTVAARLRVVQQQGGLVARLGGDEFACAVRMPAKYRQPAEALAASLISAVAEPISVSDPGIEAKLTMTIGMVAASPAASTGVNAAALLKQADIAMYRAKRQGKNRFSWFAAEMLQELELRRTLEQGIRAGLSAGEFVPFYEQQIDLETGQLTGFEMLARWQSPEHGILPPDVFIPAAEEMGVIAELSEHLISQAFSDAQEWDPELTLSVNISPVQLRDPWFAQRILKLLVKHNFPPSRLDIEITESCLHDNMDEVRAMIFSLRNQGIRVSLDDFGTGYASLNQLRDLTFDHLKIDRSFVTSMTRNDANRTIVDAVVDLGKALNLPVTAEGIETEEIVSALQSRGRLKGQGHFYGKPESADAVRQRLASLCLLRQQAVAAEPEQRLLASRA